MTQPIDPTVFKKQLPPVGAPPPVPTQVAPAPPPATPPATGPAPFTPPPQNPVDATTGQVRTDLLSTSGGATVKAFNANDPSTYTIRKNADGSTDYVDQSGNVAMHQAAPAATGAPGTVPGATSGTGAGAGTGGTTGNNPSNLAYGLFDLSGNTTPTPPRQPGPPTPEEKADADAYQKEIADAENAYFNANNKYPDAAGLQGIISTAAAHHPLAVAFANSNSLDPGSVSAANDQNLINRISTQTPQDIARVSEAGALGQNTLHAAAGQATNTGNTVYNDANAAANDARNLGAADLSLAVNQGTNAVNTASAMAAPLAGLANYDVNNGAVARDASGNQIAAAGGSLANANTAVQTLQALAAKGDAAATQALARWQGSGGTAADLAALQTAASATGALGAINPNTGTAGALQDLNTAAEASGALRNFTSNNGTANELNNLPTGVSATNALGGFQPNAGESAALSNVNTNVSATGNLLGFTGNNGTADALAAKGQAPDVAGTGNLNTYTGTVGTPGGIGADQLETLDRLGSGADIGPSAAEALLKKQADETYARNIGLARSGRGAGENASALRTAAFTNAAGEQQLGNDMAALRAQEAATARGQNISAATAAAGTATTLGGQKLQGLSDVQQGQITQEQNRLSALVSSGTMSQKQAEDQLNSFIAAQQGQTQAVSTKVQATTAAGEQEISAANQKLQALQSQQQGQLTSMQSRVQALVASGQMTQEQANQQLDALKATQQGELTSAQTRVQALTAAGTQQQTATSQKITALQSQQQGQLAATQQRLDALVASGQMTQTQAAQQLDALKSTQQGELATTQAQEVAAAAAAGGATGIAGVQADLGKALATVGLQYDVNSGNVMNDAGQIVMSGQQVNQAFTSAGLSAQVGQGQVGASVTNAGMNALTTLTNTSVDAQKAAATLGFQTAAAIASLSQAELSELQGIIQTQNAAALQKYALDKNIALQVDAQNAQQTGAIFSALGTIVAGAAVLSDVNAKTNIAPMDAGSWFSQNGLNMPAAGAPASPGMSNAQKLQLISMGGQLGGALGKIASDKKGKKDKKPESFDEWLKTMPTDFRSAQLSSFKYKDPKALGAESGPQTGVMAQDLQKTAAGGAVSKMPNGMLGVDPRKTIMPMMGAMGEQQRRIDTLEHVVMRLTELAKK